MHEVRGDILCTSIMEKTATYKRWVRRFATRYWWIFIALSIMSIVSVGFTLITPIPLTFLADHVLTDAAGPTMLGVTLNASKEQLLLYTVAAYLGVIILSNAFSSLRAIIELRLSQIVDMVSMSEVAEAAVRIPYNSTKREQNGEYLYRITTQSRLMSEYIFGNYSVILQCVITIASIGVVLLMVDWRMTVLVMAVVPVLVGIVQFFGKRIEQRAVMYQDAESSVYNSVGESLEKVRTIQEFGLEARRTGALNALITISNRTGMRALFVNQGYSMSTETIILFAMGSVILVGGHLVLSGSMTFGMLLLFISYVSSISDPVVTLASAIGSMREQSVSLRQARTVIDSSDELRLTEGAAVDTNPTSVVAYHNVSYVRDGHEIAKNISIEFSPGNVYVITGPSGEGKSTLLSMIQRFISPTAGKVTIDGVDVREYDIDYLRSRVAVVNQQPELFDGTVSENITISDPEREFSLLHVMSAADISNSNEFIDRLPDKYDTSIDDDRLSGGQKQRISIARASYRQAPVIIMDEPTSALDRKSSDIFLGNIAKYYANRTVIIVTHDQNVIQHFSNVLLLKDGQLIPYSSAPSIPNRDYDAL